MSPTEPRPSLDEINEVLQSCVEPLSRAAELVRDAEFNSSENIRHVGSALVEIFAIQHQIYAVRDDLMPEDFKETPDPVAQLNSELDLAASLLISAGRWVDATKLDGDATRRRLHEAVEAVRLILNDLRIKHPPSKE